MTGKMAKQQLGNDPVIQQHTGEIQSISPNIAVTNEEQQKRTSAGTNVIVFDVSGSKGSGQIVTEQPPCGPPANQPGKIFTKATPRTHQGELPFSP